MDRSKVKVTPEGHLEIEAPALATEPIPARHLVVDLVSDEERVALFALRSTLVPYRVVGG